MKKKMERSSSKISNLWIFSMLLLQAVVSAEDCQCNSQTLIIDCSYRSLTTLTETLCTDFKRIDLSHNNFENIPEERIMEFEFINISYNLLKSIDSEYALSVRILDISANKIEHIELGSSYRYLEKLYAANNNLKGGEYMSIKSDKLQDLDVSHNRVTSLQPVTTCKELTHLNASHNRIQIISDSMKLLVQLKVLDLSNNLVQSLSYLPRSVETLILSRNKLQRVEKSSFAELQALKILDLSGNGISELESDAFASLSALELLDLSRNALSAVPHLELPATARRVDVRGNSISSVDADAAMSLLGSGEKVRLVDLTENPLSAADPGLRALVLQLDASDGTVNVSADCACAVASRDGAALSFCVVKERNPAEEGGACWVDVARETTTSSTTTASPTAPSTSGRPRAETTLAPNASAELISDGMTPEATNIDVIAHASHFMSSLGAAQLSFLVFLLLTLAVLIVINCIVGDPVVDERWWEEKLRGDRVVS